MLLKQEACGGDIVVLHDEFQGDEWFGDPVSGFEAVLKDNGEGF